MRLNLVTGAETQVGSFSYSWAIISDPPSLDWSADGRQFLVSEQPAPGLPVRLALMDSVTGKLSPLTQPSYGTSGDFDGRFSPDGTSIAFRRGGLGDLCSASLRDGEKDVHRLTTSGMGVRGIAWSTDNHFIFFGNHRDSGGYSIWRKSTASGETQALTAFGFDATEPALSPDAKYLAFVHHERVVNLVEESLAGGAERVLSPSDRLDSSPVFSDDGRYLAFISIRSGSEELWMQSADGAGLTQLTFLHGAGRPLNASWAPDGKSIVVAIRQEDSTNLFLCALQARRLQQLTFVKDRLVSPLFSRDGRFIYFSSNAEGENRIWRMSTAGNGKPEQMFGDTTSFFQQSEDGRYLYFLGSGQTLNVLRRDLVTGELRSVFKSDQHVFPFPAFVIAGPILYIALPEAPTRSGASILALNLSRNTATSVLHVKRFIAGIPPGLAYSPTRKSLVIPEIQRDNADIYTLPLAP
jgi:Tol biopolymer transport system component